MAFTGARGHNIDKSGNIYAVAAEAITLPAPNVALGVVYSAEDTVRLPDADAEQPAGVIYEESVSEGDKVYLATKGQVWMIAAEAIATMRGDLMLDDATGYVLNCTSAAAKLGQALTLQASVGGMIYVDLTIGSDAPA
jgi:hypothetical protein